MWIKIKPKKEYVLKKDKTYAVYEDGTIKEVVL